MTWTDAFTEVNSSVDSYFGELLNYESLDGLTVVTGMTATMRRGNEDGQADIDIPTSFLQDPEFGAVITDSNAVEWRIYNTMQTFSDRTPCELMRSGWWYNVDIEYYRDDTDVWDTHTTNVLAAIKISSSGEILDPEDNHIINTFVVRTQYLSSTTHKMRIKWGSRYLYITGIRPDDSNTRWVDMDCTEEEA